MSLSFPASPTVGQKYQTWVWNGTSWDATPGGVVAANITLEVQLNANQTGLTAAAWNTIKYDTKITDVQNAYSTSTGVFTPTVAGVYAVSASIGAGMVAASQTGVAILKNGSLTQGETQSTKVASTAQTSTLSASALIYCNGTTDTISVQGYVAAGITAFQSSANAAAAVNMVATLLQTGPPGPPGTPATIGNKVLVTAVDIAAAVTNVDFFQGFDGTYNELELDFWDVSPATEAAPILRCSTDGATFDTGSTAYNYMYQQVNSTGTGSSVGSAAAQIQLGGVLGTATQSNCYGKIRILRTPNVRPVFLFHTSWANSGGIIMGVGSGIYSAGSSSVPQLLKGLRFLISGSPNITRGSFRLYGIAK